MRPAQKKIALERMRILIDCAVSNARTDPELAQSQARAARRISTRHKIGMPYDIRMTFCKKCKKFMAPGIGSRIRVGRSQVRSVRITCNLCGHTYRKIMRPAGGRTQDHNAAAK